MTLGSKSRVMGAVAVISAICALGACSNDSDAGFVSDEDLASLSEFQRNILDDQKVTWAEYESATLAQHTCLEDAGYAPGPIEPKGSRLEFITDVDYTSEADPGAADARFLEIYETCESTYVRMVGTVWSQGLVVSDDGEREELRRSLAECLEDAGLDVTVESPIEQLLAEANDRADVSEQVGKQVQTCLDDHDRLFIATTN